ncbi:uridine kinase family protein [Demetria terragena]|uniref:uridine kinase family protein n=1 Tax=Demetria terragena TaxID=63959 RepID=UPI00036CAC71|nr:AAA family ATPase [Demetria terragena]
MTGRTVVLLSGPSGAGKSRLAQRLSQEHGWPIVRLDDFYKEAGDPSLPMTDMGVPDWDDLRSFDLDTAVDALATLCAQGHTTVPQYAISTSAVVGTAHIDASRSPHVLAEGIFAAHAIAPLEQRGVLHAAYCIRQDPWVTFGRRLLRDLAERRKPPPVLLRRGLRLRAAEAGIVQAQSTLGARPARPGEAEVWLRGG